MTNNTMIGLFGNRFDGRVVAVGVSDKGVTNFNSASSAKWRVIGMSSNSSPRRADDAMMH
ncbi:hypothetical protein ACRQ5Q_17895 [Bradyrhizobium sp. PMVTL-01]|uniref:hypothetical protein n=1 Tax=Bradyrhizobium sp. PMVTL-01 TaxID=3434999 RepID=UPI003F71F376